MEEVNQMSRDAMQIRCINTELETRMNEDNGMFIEGYFIVFNKETELWPGAYEKVASGALDNTLSNDIRALINHETRLVLGRNKAGTLELKVDSRGLWGRIQINENDSEAVNLYERVKRGDVDQCSFGFNIAAESTEYADDGSVHWTIDEVELHEVSVVTFPAYEDTGVQARKRDFESLKKRELEQRKIVLKERLQNGTKTTDVNKQD